MTYEEYIEKYQYLVDEGVLSQERLNEYLKNISEVDEIVENYKKTNGGNAQ